MKKIGKPISNLAGQEYGRLTVVSLYDVKNKNARWLCSCKCGNPKIVYGCHLKTGKTTSCGCVSKEIVSEFSTTHGLSSSPEYNAWQGMKGRCNTESNTSYPNYGARGIKVCERWLHSFENFLEDMGKKPSEVHSIERKDNNGDYEPENCIWATKDVQSNNMRSNRILVWKGQSKPLTQWANELGIKAGTITSRVNRGWTSEKALSTPLRCQA